MIKLLFVFALIMPNFAFAFGCYTRGVDVSVDNDSLATGASLQIADMSPVVCYGYGTNALRLAEAPILHPDLVDAGFELYVQLSDGSIYPLSEAKYKCVWPYNYSSTYCGKIDRPNTVVGLKLKFGFYARSGRAKTVFIPAGTQIINFTTQQKANYWGYSRTFYVTNTNDINIPGYTCTINNADQTVTMPTVTAADLRSQGAGQYPAATAFNLKLDCTEGTKISGKFSSTTMAGTNDVLVNTKTGNDSIGVQIKYDDSLTPVVIGESFNLIDDADTSQTLPFNAYYYYNGGAVTGGEISSRTTFTLTYY